MEHLPLSTGRLSSNRFRESCPPPFPLHLVIKEQTPLLLPQRKLTVVESLKVVGEGQNVGVPDRDATENCDFVADHMFLALHQLLVDDLDGITLSCLNLCYLYSDQSSKTLEHVLKTRLDTIQLGRDKTNGS